MNWKLTFFGSGRQVMFQGKPLPPKLERHTGRHRELFTRTETSAETNGRVEKPDL